MVGETVELFDLDIGSTFLISQKALIEDNDQILILQNTLGEVASWELPGGLLNLNEPLHDGLLREVKEETGLKVSIGNVFATWDHWERGFIFRDGRTLDVRIIEIASICRNPQGQIRLSDEHQDYRWVDRNELKDFLFFRNSDVAIQKYLATKH